MDFTKSFVKSKNPCADGFRWYLRHHREGSGYQQVLDALVDAGRVEDACWLLDKVGPANTVLELDRIECDALVFAGSVHVRGGITAEATLRAGGAIRCGGALRAGGEIVAGEDVSAAGGVHAGAGIRCGGALLASWHSRAAAGIVAGSLKVRGSLDCAGSLAIGGVAWIDGDLQVGGDCSARFLRVRGGVHAGGLLRTREGLVCDGGALCGGHIDAGSGIKCGGDVVAAGAIRAGESIEAGGEIRAGAGYGVFAGLCVQGEEWDTSARVTARSRPARLLSGFWTGDPGTATEPRHAH
ncbi:MAG: hypothetical protein ACO1PB_09525 [Ramlibacter sp.]